jgi:TRAP-type C4-dicarboxylate transport system substrate-binding protein
MKKLLKLVLCLLLALSVSLPSTAIAAKKSCKGIQPEHVLRFSTVAPANTPWARLLKNYKRVIRKKSNCRIKVKVSLGGMKGSNELGIVRLVRKGKELEAGGVSSGAIANQVRELDLLELPYLFNSAKEADRILDGVALPFVEKALESQGFKLLMYSENGYRSMGTKGFKVTSPKDLVGKKMRSQESDAHVATWRSFGASPVTMSVGEVMSALQTGNVTGFDNTPLYTQAVSWYQAIDHFTLTRHIYQPAVIVANKAWFDGLPADLQEILVSTGRKLQGKGRRKIRELDGALLENFKEFGIQVHTLTPAQRKVFQNASRKVWDAMAMKTTPLGRQLLSAMRKELGR